MRILTALAAGMIASGGAMAQDNEAPVLWGDAPDAEFVPEYSTPEARAYDFWIGEWRSNWRPREEDGLDHVESGNQIRQHVFTILGGKALLEFAEPFKLDSGVAAGRGFSLRYLDGETGNWIMAQHWPNPNWDGVAFTDQLTGPAHHGRIQVYSHDVPRSTPEQASIRRYTFSDVAPDRFRWDGANTEDGGDSWSVWQIVDFYRQEDDATRTPRGGPWPGHHDGMLCTDEAHRAMDGMVGTWNSTFVTTDGSQIPGEFAAGPMLDGCGIGAISRIGSREYFLAWAWSPMLGQWIQLTLSDVPGERHHYAMSSTGGAGATFLAAPNLTIQSATHTYYSGMRTASADARSRQVIEVFESDRIEIRMQWRSDAESDWAESGRLVLTR